MLLVLADGISLFMNKTHISLIGNLLSKKKKFSRVRIPINTFYATSKSLNAALAKNVIKILSMVETVSHYF